MSFGLASKLLDGLKPVLIALSAKKYFRSQSREGRRIYIYIGIGADMKYRTN